MAPSSDKNKVTTGLGIITSALLSPQSPQHASPMSFDKFFVLPPRSNSSPSSSTPVTPRSPLGPGSSKMDYGYGLDPSSSPTSPGLAQSYYDEAPPPYIQQNDYKGESPLKALGDYDIVVVLDDSHSMTVADGKGGKTRWDQAWSALETLVIVGSRYDRDGIQIHFLNKKTADRKVKNVANLRKLRKDVKFPEKGSYTPTGGVLDKLLREYKRKLSSDSTGVKKKIFLVITDGAATDAPEDVIIHAAGLFNDFPLDQVGIQFIQVGNDPEATRFLEELDESLTGQMVPGNARDMVDTIKSTGDDLEGDTLIKALTGGFNRRQDRVDEKGHPCKR